MQNDCEIGFLHRYYGKGFKQSAMI